MARRWIADLGIGLALTVAGQFAQLAGGGIGRALGLPFPYDMAPDDGSVPDGLKTQISLMFMIAAVLMLVLTFGLAWARRTSSAAEGAARGVAWAAVVGLSQFLLMLGDGVVPVFGLAGTWVYLAAIVVGPVLAGLVRGRSLATAGAGPR